MFSVPVGNDYLPVDPLNEIMRAYNNAKNSMHQQDDQMAARAASGQELQSRLNLQASEADKNRAQAGNIPVENIYKNLDLQQKFGQLQNSSSRFGQFHQMMSFISTPEGSKAISENPEMAKNVLTMANQAAYEGAQSKSNPDVQFASQIDYLKGMMPGNEEKKLSPLTNSQESALGKNYVPDAKNNAYVDKSGDPVPFSKLATEQKQAMAAVTAAQINSFRNAANDTFVKQTTTTNVRNQRKALTSLMNTLEESKKHINGYLKFFDASHKAGMFVTKFAEAAGKDDPNFNDYNIMKTTILPTINGEYRKMVGGNASDKETAFIDDIINPDAWWYNPHAALAKLNSVPDTARGFAKSLDKSETGTQNQLKDIANSNPNIPYFADPSQASASPAVPRSLQVTPEMLSRASPQDAKQLGMQKLPIPQFKSPEEARAFISKVDPRMRKALIKQIFGDE